ncbi:hypothetical protein ACOSQ2_013269 [Xanthoceras sorbifolium]
MSHNTMLFIIISMIIFSSFTNANRVKLDCPNTRVYTPNSTYEHDLKLLLQSLSSNTSLNAGFYNSSVGDDTNRVYSQALCRGDVNHTACQNCIENAIQDILKNCSNEDAIIWHDLCQIHYSSQNFFSINTGYYGKFPMSNDQRRRISDSVRLTKVLKYLMNDITVEASDSPLKFAVGQINFLKSDNVYGLAQCTRDISTSYCYNCLGSALSELIAHCGDLEGGIVVDSNCNVRFELYRFYNGSSISLTYQNSAGGKWTIGMVVGIICISIVILLVLIGSCFVYLKWKSRAQTDEESSQLVLIHNLARPTTVNLTQEGDFVSSQELPFMDLTIIRAATDDFSDSNKLGQGGFGTVYKGVLPDGKEVAVKRLSRKSWQGLEEFKNEIILIAKLQHRNLVRLLGCGIEGEEKLLIYEFMPNKSLDIFIFDYEKRSQLDWKTCYEILCGIARGLLYLHEDSRLKIIHRDLKPNNVLLGEDMVAKISDFGMARIFCENQNTANTKRVVGTYGYMAPEYAMEGLFSMKSDVFSFGVILLEIISGKRNSGFYLVGQAPTLLAYAWQLWKEGKELEFVDPFLMESCTSTEILRCIQIGLLCVQEDPASRPTMSYVVALLGSDQSIALPEPRQPAISVGRIVRSDESSTTNQSINGMTYSSISPR